MYAEVIAIGDELTSGVRLDTNSQWLSQRLGELGVRTLYHSTVGDDLGANVRVFHEAFDRSDIIVCTGGLGPTADDLTRQAIAETLGVELILDEESLIHIRSMFASRKREMPERNTIQAMLPAGSFAIANPHGTAPGIQLRHEREGRNPCRLFALPGVPAEMREMWAQTVSPAIQELTGGRRVIRHHEIKCFGVGESDLEQMLPDIIARGRQPSVGITVHKATITLRITAEAESEAACLEAMEPTISTIRDCLGSLIFGEQSDELQHAVSKLLRERSQTLATFEWGSGGLLAEWLSDADEQNVFYRGGVVARSQSAVEAVLREINEANSSLEESSMLRKVAAHIRDQFSADYALCLGAFPVADGSTSELGELYFALATKGNVVVKSAPFVGHPDILKERAVKQALNFLRTTLISSSE
ncbi:MAG: CinA family nicotinamide mononucleotide deamidase-related protein [Planctomycetaceae bacterium]|nr:CinA family nicotinamide mononucleotide deamidase-related protein [Planctomycetales bacterium]MCB9924994.1 CinA family nicotinamide mononucleotide deamidase-related protein [Planctomycetaceae bacterium]